MSEKFKFDTLPVIYSDNLILREIETSDADDMQAILCDIELYKYWGSRPAVKEKLNIDFCIDRINN